MKRVKCSKSLKQLAYLALACLLVSLLTLRPRWRRPEEPPGGPDAAPAPAGRPLRPFRASLSMSGADLERASLEFADWLAANSSRLLHLSNLSRTLEPSWALECPRPAEAVRLGAQAGPRELTIVINSKWSNFARRQRLRAGWLRRRPLRQQVCSGRLPVSRLRLALAVGAPETEQGRRLLEREQLAHGDLLGLELPDEYRASMTLKHLAALKWFAGTSKQPGALLLKCDDDAQVDLGQLLALLHERGVGGGADEPDNWLMCARFPANSRVARRAGSSKWSLDERQFAFDTFPAYCSGLAYVAPARLARRLLLVAHALERQRAGAPARGPLWVDDVYVTGVLVSSLVASERPRVLELNEHFCWSRAQMERRARARQPCAVSELPEPR